MTDDLRSLAHALDALVRSVPGVTTLFAADPALVRSVRQVTSLEEPLPLVTITSSNDVLAVVVSVGVTGDEQAPLTAAAVADAVRAALPVGAAVSVRVSRVVD
jgi:hypothetical protein